MPFTWLDIVLIAIMLISAILAMMRGFTREVLSIVAWIGAAIGAYLLYLPLLPLAQEYIQPEMLAKGVLIGGSFFAILIGISLLVILMSLSLVGIISVQLYWIKSSVEDKEEQIISYSFNVKLKI